MHTFSIICVKHIRLNIHEIPRKTVIKNFRIMADLGNRDTQKKRAMERVNMQARRIKYRK